MKPMKFIMVICLLLLPLGVQAEDDRYRYCEIAGIASGVEDVFIRDLASRILEKQGLRFDNICMRITKESARFGRQYASGNKSEMTEHLRWMRYQNLRDKVMDAMIDLIGN